MSLTVRKSYVNGFNAHKEIVKDKLLSIQLYSNNNHLEWIYNRMIEVHGYEQAKITRCRRLGGKEYRPKDV
jgi:anaerobic glycerol-3-phosphate dehydrogenase